MAKLYDNFSGDLVLEPSDELIHETSVDAELLDQLAVEVPDDMPLGPEDIIEAENDDGQAEELSPDIGAVALTGRKSTAKKARATRRIGKATPGQPRILEGDIPKAPSINIWVAIRKQKEQERITQLPEQSPEIDDIVAYLDGRITDPPSVTSNYNLVRAWEIIDAIPNKQKPRGWKLHFKALQPQHIKAEHESRIERNARGKRTK